MNYLYKIHHCNNSVYSKSHYIVYCRGCALSVIHTWWILYCPGWGLGSSEGLHFEFDQFTPLISLLPFMPSQSIRAKIVYIGDFHTILSIYLSSREREESIDTFVVVVGHVKAF